MTHDTSYAITYEGEYKYYDECSAKVLYYNAENHRLILEGDMFNRAHKPWNIERLFMSGYVDIDSASRQQTFEKYCGEK